MVKDRLFIFGNIDRQLRSEPVIVTSGTVLDGFDATLSTIANADDRQLFQQARDLVRSLTGDFDRDINQYTGLIRADWHPNSRRDRGCERHYSDRLVHCFLLFHCGSVEAS